MTTFLNRLVERAHDTAPRVRPLVASRYEPSGGIPRGAEDAAIPGSAHSIRPSPMEGTARGQREGTREARPSEKVSFGSSVPSLSPPREPSEHNDERHPDPAKTTTPMIARERGVGRSVDRAEAVQPRAPRAPLAPLRAAETGQAPATIVRVTIGRIEVRAAPAPAPTPRPRVATPEPKLTLEAYLKARTEGGR